MSEYIEREAAIAVIKRLKGPIRSPAQNRLIESAMLGVDRIPAADVEPVRHGRWKYYHKQNKAVCTNCSFERDLDANFGRAISCPNCGAKMDLGRKE